MSEFESGLHYDEETESRLLKAIEAKLAAAEEAAICGSFATKVYLDEISEIAHALVETGVEIDMDALQNRKRRILEIYYPNRIQACYAEGKNYAAEENPLVADSIRNIVEAAAVADELNIKYDKADFAAKKQELEKLAYPILIEELLQSIEALAATRRIPKLRYQIGILRSMVIAAEALGVKIDSSTQERIQKAEEFPARILAAIQAATKKN